MKTRVAGFLLFLTLAVLAQDSRFVPVDVFIDAGDSGLAAWQIEVDAGRGARVAGIEGGAAPAFAEPAYYDPAALAGGRIVLAAFTLSPDAPRGRTRVARLHFMESGGAVKAYRAEVIAAAAPGGRRIPIEVELVRNGEGR